jgi:hypothetical protein
MSSKFTNENVLCKCLVCGTEFHPSRSAVGRDFQLIPGTGIYCSVKCSGIGRRGPRKTTEERFWAKVNKDGPIPEHCPELGPCWVWTRAKDARGYGKIGIPRGLVGKYTTATTHRLSYEWEFDPIPDGLIILHRCDNPPCCRPSHLRLGTQSDNAKDTIAKGRHPFLCDKTRIRRGEENSFATLTEDSVRLIRKLRQEGKKYVELAELFGCTTGCISGVLTGRSWRHVV